MNWLERRKLFIVWNKACKKARQQPDSVEQILNRLNKALGILQHHDYYEAEKALYRPTFASCGCKDWEFRNAANRKYTGPCKHMAALILEQRVKDLKYQQGTFLDSSVVIQDTCSKETRFPGRIFVSGITA